MLDHLHASSFSAQLHTTLRVLPSGASVVTVELVEVTEHDGSHGRQPWTTSSQERFSVVFRGAGDQPLAQGLYDMQHDRLGALELFLVPVGQDRGSMYYEAVFNRLRQADA